MKLWKRPAAEDSTKGEQQYEYKRHGNNANPK